jgi:hypothetical protein
VDQSIQKCARGDYQGLASKTATILELEPGIATGLRQDPAGAAKNPFDIGLSFKGRTNPPSVKRLIRLGARRPNRRTSTAIEELELYSRSVDCLAHQSAKSINLANQMSLRRSANRRIARHVRDRFSSESAQADVASTSRRGPSGLNSGMAGANNYYI